MKARIAVLLAVVTCTSAFAATALAAPAAQSKASAGNCVVVASSNKNFSTLVSLVKQAICQDAERQGPVHDHGTDRRRVCEAQGDRP